MAPAPAHRARLVPGRGLVRAAAAVRGLGDRRAGTRHPLARARLGPARRARRHPQHRAGAGCRGPGTVPVAHAAVAALPAADLRRPLRDPRHRRRPRDPRPRGAGAAPGRDLQRRGARRGAGQRRSGDRAPADHAARRPGRRRLQRRRSSRTVTALLLAALLAVSAPPPPPNVVLIVTDDQTLRDMQVMPRTRAAIGAQGVTFTDYRASYPLCCPARASILTGQYAHNHHVLGNISPHGGIARLDQQHTVPVALSERPGADYVTAHVGKYLNGYGHAPFRGIPPGWSNWHGSLT